MPRPRLVFINYWKYRDLGLCPLVGIVLQMNGLQPEAWLGLGGFCIMLQWRRKGYA